MVSGTIENECAFVGVPFVQLKYVEDYVRQLNTYGITRGKEFYDGRLRGFMLDCGVMVCIEAKLYAF